MKIRQSEIKIEENNFIVFIYDKVITFCKIVTSLAVKPFRFLREPVGSVQLSPSCSRQFLLAEALSAPWKATGCSCI
jgi:hypothetical protein